MDEPLYVLRDRIIERANPNLGIPNRTILYYKHFNESFIELDSFLDDVGKDLALIIQRREPHGWSS